MRHFQTLAAAILLLLVVAPSALADIAPPDRKKVDRPGVVRTDLPYGRMTIETVDGLREARLQVPRDILAKLAPARQESFHIRMECHRRPYVSVGRARRR